MTNILDLLRPDFLLHNALWGSIAVGLFCPLIGVYFMLRRMVLLGVALPQISGAGIAFAFLLQGLGLTWSLHAGEANDRFLALIGSTVFTILALVILAALERRGEGTTESRIGATYALAYAAAILFVSAHPEGKIEILSMLHGEIVSVNGSDLHLLLAAYAVLAVILLLFNNQFVLVSFDRESARVLGKKVAAWDLLLYVVIGLAIAMSVLIVGPMLTFSFLIIPPLTVRRFCRRMRLFFILSSLVGGVAGLVGFVLSYQLDWPLGPADIVVSSGFLVVAFLVKKIWDLSRSARAA